MSEIIRADIFEIICGDDPSKWPKLRCGDSKQLQVDGDVNIGTAMTPATLRVNGLLAVGTQTVIDSTGKWVGSPDGLKGDSGDPGPQGLQGSQGDRGPQGEAGPTRAERQSGSARLQG